MKPWLALFFWFFSCSCEPETVHRSQAPIPICAAEGQKADLSVLTYNAGLGPGIDLPYYSQRIAPAIQAVSDNPADIICLNEIWTDEAKDEVIDKLNLPPSQVLMVSTKGLHENPRDRCAPGEMDDLLSCLHDHCAGLPDEEVTRCAQKECRTAGAFLYLWHRPCFNCLVAAPGKNADQISRDCYGRGASRMYEGRNGIVLASRLPMTRREWIDIPSSSANRVGLFATIDVHGTKVEVACTHLSGRPDYVFPDDPKFPDWQDEMKAQIRLVSEKLSRRARGRPQLLLGDLNTGPNYAGDKKPVETPVWDEVSRLGFDSPAAATMPSICSRCCDNLLTPTDADILIDHVLVRDAGPLVPFCAASVFHEPIKVMSLTGEEKQATRSDHDGVNLQFIIKKAIPFLR